MVSLSIMRKLNCGEPKLTQMTLTLTIRSMIYPYGIIEDVMVRVDDLVLPTNFVI